MSPHLYFLLPFTLLFVVSECRKAGTCPPAMYSNICSFTCFLDEDCPGTTKCCRTFCGGSLCTAAVTQNGQETSVNEKPGFCPTKPSGPWVCSSRCSTDSDCRGNKKCCKNRCGAKACMKPEENNESNDTI